MWKMARYVCHPTILPTFFDTVLVLFVLILFSFLFASVCQHMPGIKPLQNEKGGVHFYPEALMKGGFISAVGNVNEWLKLS